MLWNASVIKGYAIAASDGRLGTVSDFLFDDASWGIRWLVVDTGNWLSGRKVLLPALGQLDPERNALSVELTMQQVKDSPDIDTDLPVSRQMETNIYDYYGWSPYWGNGLFTDSYGYVGGALAQPPMRGTGPREEEIADPQRSDGDPHLRSVETVTGYHMHASDGEIGHVADFLLDDVDWSVHYFIVDTKNWRLGKKVLISPRSVREIDWANRLVHLDVDRRRVKDSPAYDASTTLNQAYEQNMHSHYGKLLPTELP
jgi:hypothetical protein